MANMLGNMLTLQTQYSIPMRMDLSTKGLLEYYQAQPTEFSAIEKNALLKAVIADLKSKVNPQL